MIEIPKFDFLYDYLKYWASKDPEFPFFKFKWRKYNAKEFLDTIDHLAEAFLNLGIKKGDTIVTILPMIIEYPLIELAAQSIGAIVVPMDVRFRPADFRRFILHVKPKLVILIGQARGYDLGKKIKELSAEFDPEINYFMIGRDEFGHNFDDLLEGNYNLKEELISRRAELDPDDGALIIFTGGTTGVPKAALMTHRNIAYMSYYEATFFAEKLGNLGISERFPILQNFPPSHAGGSVEIMGTAIAAGCEIILQEQWNPYAVLRAIKKYKMPLLGGVPTMLAIILSLPDLDTFDLSSLKLVMMSGEKLSLDLLVGVQKKVCPNIINGYGSTEIGTEVSFTELGDAIEDIANGYIGIILPEQEIKIVNDEGKTLPPGEIGEMLFRGTLCIPEYYNMPEENRETFTQDGWCKSGDLGYITQDGRLYIKGRKKFIIRVGSYTVLPSEVEEVVITHPNIALAAAVGMPDKIYNEVVWLVVVLEEGKSIEIQEIFEICKNQLADFKVPKKIIVKKEIPLTRLGKVDRPNLQKKLNKEFS